MEDKYKEVICYAKSKLLLAGVIIIWLPILAIIFTIQKGLSAETIGQIIPVLSVLGLMGLTVTLHYFNTTVKYVDGKIVHKNLFGITQKYKLESMEDICSIKDGGIRLYFKHGKVDIHGYYKNNYDVIKCINKWKEKTNWKSKKLRLF